VSTDAIVTLLVGAVLTTLVTFGIVRLDRLLQSVAELKTTLLGANGHSGVAARVERMEATVDDHGERIIVVETMLKPRVA
jgi:multisubunit Na+/H+ antiporter MnhG subunit